ncbi:MAG: alpha/beta hydrolase [Planctomycetota bacterium]
MAVNVQAEPTLSTRVSGIVPANLPAISTRLGGRVSRMLIGAALVWLLSHVVAADQFFQLRNGVTLHGVMTEVASLQIGPGAAGNVAARPYWRVDDGLRKNYFHGRGMLVGDPFNRGGRDVTLNFWQPVGKGNAVGGLGSILDVSPFNDFGRRRLRMRGPTGAPIDVFQGIVEINSEFAQLIALEDYEWDMRVATSSIDSETLMRVFRKRTDPKDLDERLELVRFFTEAKRYAPAREALSQIIKDFPAQKEKLSKNLIVLAEQQGNQLIDEALLRAESGQRRLATEILSRFPISQVGRVQRIRIQQALERIEKPQREADAAIAKLQAQVAALPAEQGQALQPIMREISAGLSADTLTRLNDYLRLSGSDRISDENKVALAISGWLLGEGQGIQNFAVALALYPVRDWVAEYLAQPDPVAREAILNQIRGSEGGRVEWIAKMLPRMTPVLAFPETPRVAPENSNPGKPKAAPEGYHEIIEDDFEYAIQLPPEYNPLREYPCVIALPPARATPLTQIQWWCGDIAPGEEAGATDVMRGQRLGQAARYGVIVVAPSWGRPQQRMYEYNAIEHHRVLRAMRHAMRRASIDADRVYLFGQGEGATAAMDIAASHPDLWAGMVTVGGSPSKMSFHYHDNSAAFAKYLVMGEKDGMRPDGTILERMMGFDHNTLVVMYRGRGNEDFYGELPRIMTWLSSPANVRPNPPREINAFTMRPHDNFFWWLELGEIRPNAVIHPMLWERAERKRAAKISGEIMANNSIRFSGPSDRFSLRLSPIIGIDFGSPIEVRRGANPKVNFDGNPETILEDVRTRADRKRPCWMQIDWPPVP